MAFIEHLWVRRSHDKDNSPQGTGNENSETDNDIHSLLICDDFAEDEDVAPRKQLTKE